MIEFDQVSFRYSDQQPWVLREANFTIDEGELVVVTGPTGAGKSTVLQAVNGLVPHFTGGELAGEVRISGRSTRDHPPRELAELIGRVGQDPAAGFVTDVVEAELAYSMEQLAVPAAAMRTRVEEVLDLLGIAEIRDRPLRALSGGQQQRVAIAAALTTGARVLILDEPTSALDPTSAEEVLAAILRLVHDLGVTALIAEHRLERVIGYADRMLHVPGDGSVRLAPPAAVLQDSALVPPVIDLGRRLGWQPLPLTVRDARRTALRLLPSLPAESTRRDRPAGPPALTTTKLCARYGAHPALQPTNLVLHRGQVTILMGRNGSGKSSLLWALAGARTDATLTGSVRTHGPGAGGDRIALVPQSATDLLFLPTVAEECASADEATGSPPGTCRELLDRFTPGIDPAAHPRDLSAGQQLSLVLAIQLVGSPSILLLDEPTRGLDYPAKRALAAVLSDLADRSHAVLVATHDVEFAAEVADRALILAEGELIADDSPLAVLAGSASLAPQVWRVLAPLPYLTVEEVTACVRSAN